METTKKKEPMIILTGPTGVGKTDLSIRLAREIDAEIISADSMQVYRYMDIGSAKVTREEMQGVPHHLIDCLMPDDEFNVVVFCRMAKEAAADIRARGKLPLVVGGTGFYIQALLYDIDFTEMGEDAGYRDYLRKMAAELGGEWLHERLLEVDPEAAAAIDPMNIKRQIRALEYYRQTGRKISDHNREQREKESPYDFRYFVLNRDRGELYERINRRVDIMMDKGLPDEVKRLKDMGYTKENISMQGIGYKELLDFYEGKCPLEEAADQIKLASRHFAKRQLTWFRRERDVRWIEMSGRTEEEIMGEIRKQL